MPPLHNFTRRSESIPRRLLREGKPHLLPIYGLMLTSELAREGIERSGSFRFADHVYRARPAGRFGVGYILDAALLRMPAARSMRNRYFHARDEIVAEVGRRRGASTRVLSVPCGIARELVSAADVLAARDKESLGRVQWFGMDLDAEPLALSVALAKSHRGFTFIQRDAFDPAAYPPDLDIATSTGLLDFLDDDDALRFFAACKSALRPGGLFITSSQMPQRLADYLMRELAELRPRYRDARAVTTLLERAGFVGVVARPDSVGLQTLVTARRSAA